MPKRPGWLPRLALGIAVVVGALAAACSGDDDAPSRLLDGSPAPHLPVEIEGRTAPPVLTNVRIVPLEDIEAGSMSASCLQGNWGAAEPGDRVVERTGVLSETVTFRDRSGEGLYGCDNSAGSREDDRRWCGGAFGRLNYGRLRDPRLDLGGCSTRDEEPVGFVWVEPHQDARYVVVEQPGYAEVYRVAGDLPVRVATTSDVEMEGSRATFHLSEHDAEGQLLRRYEIEAAVAG
jgi:hypothetical protein